MAKNRVPQEVIDPLPRATSAAARPNKVVCIVIIDQSDHPLCEIVGAHPHGAYPPRARLLSQDLTTERPMHQTTEELDAGVAASLLLTEMVVMMTNGRRIRTSGRHPFEIEVDRTDSEMTHPSRNGHHPVVPSQMIDEVEADRPTVMASIMASYQVHRRLQRRIQRKRYGAGVHLSFEIAKSATGAHRAILVNEDKINEIVRTAWTGTSVANRPKPFGEMVTDDWAINGDRIAIELGPIARPHVRILLYFPFSLSLVKRA
mmetsp:Transcript_16799/g.47097  ORF Transcript_16799/g.47097 Transcript_16799/m.47097 type:complete len:260 (-) Transcript_16799:121-900(-)